MTDQEPSDQALVADALARPHAYGALVERYTPRLLRYARRLGCRSEQDAKDVLLKELADVARELGVEPLVEVFTKDSVEPALKSGARLIGINTRNLRTLTMHSDNVAVLSALIPADRAIVAESGIKTPDDVRKLAPHKVKAILVGESLLKQSDPIKATHELAEAV
jgi:indole-3-glycerol phosphate synthase